MEKPFEEFGSMIFGETQMKELLPRPIYLSWKKTVENQFSLDRQTADAIAHAMKRWALDKGATHYTHWFQPMTGSTAQKNEAFINPDENNQPMTRFSGKTLIKGETDGSSFPSGGLRATFEARGYTYWDVTSPVFIRDNVLCIPTVFVSYNGESLDKKAPLLKSIKALSHQATRVVNLLGEKDVTYCKPVVGLEQEYFLIDEKYYEKRRDIKMTGRTLFGDRTVKAQELEDHYFGSIPTRVLDYMNDVNQELWKLGIYAKAEHNEVAPGQFEIAPVFSDCNIAVDQNQLMMDVLRRTATKHHMACLLHEKPFARINGSGKHNNYSIITSNGQNLFSPGEKPAENIRFLVFICAFLKAVDTYPELLRMSASSCGNDERLGASEAPPAIISVYLGHYIENILNELIDEKDTKKKDERVEFNPISGLSYIPHDNADRNRTSPVAFTGNKFEFRMLGSSLSASMANVVLNTIFADALKEIADELEGIKYVQDVRAKAMEVCKQKIKEHKRILFSGDGYSKEWIEEAKRRGLPNIASSIESYDILDDKKTFDLFERFDILSKVELQARKNIYVEQYIKTMGIEARTIVKTVKDSFLPAMIKELAHFTKLKDEVKIKNPYIDSQIKTLSSISTDVFDKTTKLEHQIEDLLAKHFSFEIGMKIRTDIVPLMKEIRTLVDAYEAISEKDIYPLPTYEQMLFTL